jgi:hypothetical protein
MGWYLFAGRSTIFEFTCDDVYADVRKMENERGERARASKKGLMGSKSYALDGVGVL